MTRCSVRRLPARILVWACIAAVPAWAQAGADARPRLIAMDVTIAAPLAEVRAQQPLIQRMLMDALARRQPVAVVGEPERGRAIAHAESAEWPCQSDGCLRRVMASARAELLLQTEIGLYGSDCQVVMRLRGTSGVEVATQSRFSSCRPGAIVDAVETAARTLKLAVVRESADGFGDERRELADDRYDFPVAMAAGFAFEPALGAAPAHAPGFAVWLSPDALRWPRARLLLGIERVAASAELAIRATTLRIRLSNPSIGLSGVTTATFDRAQVEFSAIAPAVAVEFPVVRAQALTIAARVAPSLSDVFDDSDTVSLVSAGFSRPVRVVRGAGPAVALDAVLTVSTDFGLGVELVLGARLRGGRFGVSSFVDPASTDAARRHGRQLLPAIAPHAGLAVLFDDGRDQRIDTSSK